ncbi:MAG: LD-carboxypeptidase [Myxococcales bacterium]|nr:LD-carboxypeptidase [Myxococcales bacterium]
MLNQPIERVRIVLPSSPVPDPDALQRGIAWLEAAGVRVDGPSTTPPGPMGFLAGPDLARAQDLAGAFAVEDVDAVWCGRGGSGALRTLSALDAVGAWAARVTSARDTTMPAHGAAEDDPGFSRLAKRAVPLVGLSDATALLLARLYDRPAGVAIHGPVITQLSRLDEDSQSTLRAWLAAPDRLPALRCISPVSHVSGRVEGTLVAGNLALLASCCGTPEQPRLAGAILLIEEIGEPAYRIDRMMAQLSRSGALQGVVGLALGTFEGCQPEGAAESCLAWWARHLEIPCLAGLPVGHGSRCQPAALGLRYLLSVDDGFLTPLESVSDWLGRTAEDASAASE